MRDFVIDYRDGSVWFMTGDTGIVRRGRVWLTGRLKDMIKSGGENVHASEVERVLEGKKGVVECSVYALPDDRWGEVVAAAIVLGETCVHEPTLSNMANRVVCSGSTTYLELKSHCVDSGLAPFKVPKYFLLIDGRVGSLPKNATGKVLKGELQEETLGILAEGTDFAERKFSKL
jgi:acyl-CoA synthetase (AMP-forming)/AMP-acid ligase II